MNDTLYWIRKAHDSGKPPLCWLITLPVKRPEILDFDAESAYTWPIHLE